MSKSESDHESRSGELIPCPQCAELIRPAAKVCRYCRCDIQQVISPPVAYPLPSMDPEQVSCEEFMQMAIALTKVRDEEPMTQHEKRLVQRFSEMQAAHGEDRLKEVMARKLAERQLGQIDAPTQALIEHMKVHVPGMKEQWDNLTPEAQVAAVEAFPDVCEECGARANMLFEAVVPVGASTSADIGSWHGKGSFNVGTTVETQTSRVCLRCRDQLQPPISENDQKIQRFMAGCFWVVLAAGIVFGLAMCAKKW